MKIEGCDYTGGVS